jgi:hypothetical protein
METPLGAPNGVNRSVHGMNYSPRDPDRFNTLPSPSPENVSCTPAASGASGTLTVGVVIQTPNAAEDENGRTTFANRRRGSGVGSVGAKDCWSDSVGGAW